METARRKKVQRFVHVSTDEVYGSLPPGKTADEEASLRPRNPYAASKAASDLLVGSFWQTYGFPVIITRCSNNYGPYQFPEKLIPLAITNVLEEKRVPVYGDGLNERDWVYVEDHCRALDQILRSGEPGEIYNIASGEPIPNLELVRRLLRMLGKPDDIIEFVMDRPGHDRRYALDTNKIRRQLNWAPAVELDEGLARTVEWYQRSAEWVKRRKAGDYLDYYEKFYTKRRTSLAQL
jgi:dTDP-glucose 4,6-dehydratase